MQGNVCEAEHMSMCEDGMCLFLKGCLPPGEHVFVCVVDYANGKMLPPICKVAVSRIHIHCVEDNCPFSATLTDKAYIKESS